MSVIHLLFRKYCYFCMWFWLYNLLGMANLFVLTSFAADFLTIFLFVKKEVNMEVMLITGAVGFVQELQVSNRIS